MLNTLAHDKHLAGVERDRTIPQLDVERTLEYEEKFVRLVILPRLPGRHQHRQHGVWQNSESKGRQPRSALIEMPQLQNGVNELQVTAAYGHSSTDHLANGPHHEIVSAPSGHVRFQPAFYVVCSVFSRQADDSPIATGNLRLVARGPVNVEGCPLMIQGLVASLVAKKASISLRAAIVGSPAASMRC